ncbi:MAG TPA: hypothetical protein VHV31_05895 [Nitrolancea sp.]|jgi:hypothetical protein|nr:hypothetical protein [Nitrolancea sp.]
MNPDAAALIAALLTVVAAIVFDIYFLKDLAKADVVLYFPPNVWSAIICLSTPLGGMAYLLFGKIR